MATGGVGLDTSIPAVVLKFDPNVMHHGGLGAIRSLGRLGVPVYGVHEGRWAPAASSRYLRGRLFWRPDAWSAEQTRAGLRALADLIGRPAVLIPTDDAGAIFLDEHGAGLRDRFLFSEPPAGLARRLADKWSMYALCPGPGIDVPLTMSPTSAREAAGFAAEVGYPMVAKLWAPWEAVGTGLRSTTILRTAADLDAILRATENVATGLLLQQHVPARPGDDWFFHGYRGERPGGGVAFTGVKDRSYPAYAGLTSLGHAARSDHLRAAASDLLERLDYRGICDLDLRRSARTGEHVLLDFNPRLGAQFLLFRDQAGLDVVRAAYADLTGQDWAAHDQVDGRTFLVENYDPLGAFGYWRHGDLTGRSWLRSLRQVDETAWFAADDLRPFGLMCLRMGWRAVSRPLARRRVRARRTAGGPSRFRAGRADPDPVPGIMTERLASMGERLASMGERPGSTAERPRSSDWPETATERARTARARSAH